MAAAGTKWNFLPFRPGLVGGHCIGVDPYYLTHKAQSIGHHPAVILAGRRVNDAMGNWVAGEILRLMAQKGIYQPGARVLILGLAFKENCPDLRNTRVIDVICELRRFNLNIDIHDPWVDAEEARREYGLELVAEPEPGAYAAVIHAVAHHQFAERAEHLRDSLCPRGVLYDVRSTLPLELVDGRLDGPPPVQPAPATPARPAARPPTPAMPQARCCHRWSAADGAGRPGALAGAGLSQPAGSLEIRTGRRRGWLQ